MGSQSTSIDTTNMIANGASSSEPRSIFNASYDAYNAVRRARQPVKKATVQKTHARSAEQIWAGLTT